MNSSVLEKFSYLQINLSLYIKMLENESSIRAFCCPCKKNLSVRIFIGSSGSKLIQNCQCNHIAVIYKTKE